MATLAKKIHIINSAGTEQTVNLYSTTGEVATASGYTFQLVDGVTAYAPLVATNHAKATSGRVLKGGTTYAWGSTTPGVAYNYSLITTAGAGTFTVPAGVNKLRVTCVGGGAGGVGKVADSVYSTSVRPANGAVAGGATSFGSVSAGGATAPSVTQGYNYWTDNEGCTEHDFYFTGYAPSYGTTNGVVGLGWNINKISCHTWVTEFIGGAGAVPLTNYTGAVIGYAGAGGGVDPQLSGDGWYGSCNYNKESYFATGGSGYKNVSTISVTSGQTISYSVGGGGAGQREGTVTYQAGYGSSGLHVWPGSSGAILVEWGEGIQ